MKFFCGIQVSPTITLFRGETVWLARYSDETVIEAYGTDVIPTPHPVNEFVDRVAELVAENNSGAVIIVEDII